MREYAAVKALLPLLRRHRLAVAGMIVLGVLSALVESVGLSLFIPLFQSVSPQADEASGKWIIETLNALFAPVPAEYRTGAVALCILVAIVAKNALYYGSRVLCEAVNMHVVEDLMSGVLRQLTDVGMLYFDRTPTAELVNTVESEVWETSNGLHYFVDLVITLSTVGALFTVLLFISWEMMLVVGLAFPLILVVVHRMTRRVEALSRLGIQQSIRLWQQIIEFITGMRAVREAGTEGPERARYERRLHAVNRTYYHLGLLSHLVRPVTETSVAVLMLGIFAIAVKGAAPLSAILTFVFVLYRLYPHVTALGEMRIKLISVLPSAQRVYALLDRSGKPYVSPGHRPFTGLQGGLAVECVSFRYGVEEPYALREVSFNIPRGKVTAVVGPSGAGKSTLVNLLLRFYEPTEGTIRVDDQALSDIALVDWRRRVSVVSQDLFLFNKTVRENIAYGYDLAPSDERIEAVARQANAHGFISRLPNGYDTKIGDRGVRLSGGQKQRLALARAMLRDPDLLILDEATSALDVLSEDAVLRALESFYQNRTVLIISHRFSAIRQADHIVVLHGGRVAEQGDAAALLGNEALFAQLHELQTIGAPQPS